MIADSPFGDAPFHSNLRRSLTPNLVRLNINGRRPLQSDAIPSLGEWLAAGGYGALFVERSIVPQAAV